jgi:PAS domain S-box-containing protein
VRTIKWILSNGYLAGTLTAAVILLLLKSLETFFAGSPPLLLFLIPVMAAAWRGGWKAGLLATLLSAAASAYFLLEPYYSIHVDEPGEKLRLGVLVAVGILLSLAITRLRRSERQALRTALEREKRLKREIAEREQAESALQEAKGELERRVAERTAELQEALQSLTERSRYLDAFFRHAITPLVFLDRDFNFIQVNEAYAQACQRSVDEFPGHNHFEFYPSEIKAIFEDVVRTRQPYRAVARPFVFPDHPDWGVTYWNWTLTPLLNGHGEVEVLVFALEDVTARRRAEIELEKHRNQLETLVRERTLELEAEITEHKHDITERKRAEEALRVADRRKNEFLAMLGHELRNPLAPIRNAVQIMRRLGISDPKLQWARDIVDRQVDHLVRLVDDLLDVSRIVQGKLALKKAPVEIAAIVGPAVEASRPLMEQRHHGFTLALPEKPIWIEGDEVRLAQVVSNLLNNAAKYTPEGGQISLSVTRENGEAAIAVSDTGEGIPEALLPHVFDLFTQAERTLDRAQGGLGLGLTIVQSIVAQHGGRVEASSRGPGQGSQFVVRLPAVQHEPVENRIITG